MWTGARFSVAAVMWRIFLHRLTLFHFECCAYVTRDWWRMRHVTLAWRTKQIEGENTNRADLFKRINTLGRMRVCVSECVLGSTQKCNVSHQKRKLMELWRLWGDTEVNAKTTTTTTTTTSTKYHSKNITFQMSTLRIIFAARCQKPWHDKLYFLYFLEFLHLENYSVPWLGWRRRQCCRFIVPAKRFSCTDRRQKNSEKNIKTDRHQLWALRSALRLCDQCCLLCVVCSLISFIKYHSTQRLHATHLLRVKFRCDTLDAPHISFRWKTMGETKEGEQR